MDLKIYYPYVFVLIAKPGSPTIAQLDIEATSLAVKWTAPADDGGSPITAYRVVILKGNTEIKNVNVTDPDTTSWNAGGLQRDTEYTVKVLAENAVFEGPPVENKVKTKYKGNNYRYSSVSFMRKNITEFPYEQQNNKSILILWLILPKACRQIAHFQTNMHRNP